MNSTNYIQGANMTPTKILISLTAVLALSSVAYATCANDIDMGSHKITTSATSFADNELTTKAQVDTTVTQGTTPITAPAGYEVIYAGGRAWLDRNVGADAAPSSWDDTTQNTLGSLFQWGRAADGHQFRNIADGDNNSDANTTAAEERSCTNQDQPDEAKFIVGASAVSGYNWRVNTDGDCDSGDARRTHFWSAPGGLNNGVCPAGWRVPSEQDFAELDITSAPDAYDKIKLSAAGYRNRYDGTIRNVGSSGGYWTSTVDGDRSRYLNIYASATLVYSYYRAYGFSVRCVKHLSN